MKSKLFTPTASAYVVETVIDPAQFQYTIDVRDLTFDEMRRIISKWFQHGKGDHRRKFWDLITGLRGPDSPSERPDMNTKAASLAYSLRRQRKYDTVEVIRNKAFFGVVGGAARSHEADHVTLPPQSQWDHFDKHVSRAAGTLGLKVVIRQEENQ